MRREIQQWIDDGKPFQLGQSLYDKYGDSSVLKGLFKIKSPFSIKTMEAELLRLLGQHREAVVRQLPVLSSKYTIEDLSPELQLEFKNKTKLFARVAQLHGDLYHARTNLKRKAIRDELMRVLDQMDRIWARCDAYIASKNEVEPAQPSPTLLIVQRNQLRVKISRAKKKGDTDLLASLTEQLTALTAQLNADSTK
jgi:hypothetical protein